MFREMRRKKQILSLAQSEEILQRATSGVLALSGDDGYPYALPLSFVYHGGKLYFHSAKTGHKLDAIGRNEKVSFCVIDQDQIIPETFTTHFRSVIVFGTIRILEDGEQARDALRLLADRYSPGRDDAREEEIRTQAAHAVILELTPQHISGKQAIELVTK